MWRLEETAERAGAPIQRPSTTKNRLRAEDPKIGQKKPNAAKSGTAAGTAFRTVGREETTDRTEPAASPTHARRARRPCSMTCSSCCEAHAGSTRPSHGALASAPSCLTRRTSWVSVAAYVDQERARSSLLLYLFSAEDTPSNWTKISTSGHRPPVRSGHSSLVGALADAPALGSCALYCTS